MRQKGQLETAVKERTQDLEKEKVELVRTREQMRHFAEHDGLTGVWNHRIIVERLSNEVDRSMRDGTPLAVILADLDYFKHINDAMGHVAGDMTLRETGAIFQHAVRSYDWVGRYGGEEFLLILPGTVLDAAVTFAERLREKVDAHTFKYEGGELKRTMSCGVAASPHPKVKDQEALVRAADDALYVAKESGRNRVIRFDGAEFNAHTQTNGNNPTDGDKQGKEGASGSGPGSTPGSPPRSTATAHGGRATA
jgi:diguanylate cyclase (GGDEF)-like protein